MDDLKYGKRDKRGNWEPFERVHNAPIFIPPFNPLAVVKWLFGYPGYILPWNLFYALVAVAVWFWATPPLAAMTNFEPGWIALILAAQPCAGYRLLRLLPPPALRPPGARQSRSSSITAGWTPTIRRSSSATRRSTT